MEHDYPQKCLRRGLEAHPLMWYAFSCISEWVTLRNTALADLIDIGVFL